MIRPKYFPDPEVAASPDGVVAVSDTLELEYLLEAYRMGIFPWPHKGLPILWFCPDPRGVLYFSKLRVNKSLKKYFKKFDSQYRVTFNSAFKEVIESCASVKRSSAHQGTWITKEMKSAYLELHKKGWAHSVEVWRGHELVGGIYGTQIAPLFSAESMFYKETNASKYALFHLAMKLKSEGHQFMDIQMLTPVTEALGGEYMPRKEFLAEIKKRQ